jgi:hypothetical protein
MKDVLRKVKVLGCWMAKSQCMAAQHIKDGHSRSCMLNPTPVNQSHLTF